jgi:Mg2+/Co2+ transporter CorB
MVIVDAVAEISEVEDVVEDVVGDVADSMMTVEGTEIVIQDGVTEVVVQVVRAVSVSHLNFSFAYSLT